VSESQTGRPDTLSKARPTEPIHLPPASHPFRRHSRLAYIPDYRTQKAAFASAPSASSAAVTEACPIEHGPIKSRHIRCRGRHRPVEVVLAPIVILGRGRC
jgi:hypothetical protein